MNAENENEKTVARRIGALDVRAPDALRGRVEAMARESAPARERRRVVRVPRLAVAIAALAATVALVVSLVGSGEPAPTTFQAALKLGSVEASGPAPAQDRAHPEYLGLSVNGTRFPYWDTRHWRAVASTERELGGHQAVTVYYRDRKGSQISYTILAGPRAPLPSRSAERTRGYYALAAGGRHVVAWAEKGNLCIVQSRSAGAQELLVLAGAAGGSAV